jgi:hypothetical protein
MQDKHPADIYAQWKAFEETLRFIANGHIDDPVAEARKVLDEGYDLRRDPATPSDDMPFGDGMSLRVDTDTISVHGTEQAFRNVIDLLSKAISRPGWDATLTRASGDDAKVVVQCTEWWKR